MEKQHPTIRTLLLIWGALMALTVGTMLAGRVTDQVSLGLFWFLALTLITGLKASLILRYYLNLRVAPQEWKMAFHFFLVALLFVVFAIFAVPV